MTDEGSNVVRLRPRETLIPMPPEIVEVVEIFHWRSAGFNEFWIAAAGPWKDEPELNRRGRHPWQRVATFPHTQAAEAAQYATEMARLLDVPIVDLAKILPGDAPCPSCGVRGAKGCAHRKQALRSIQDADG